MMFNVILSIIFTCLTIADGVNNVIITGTDVKLSQGVVYGLKSVSSGRYLDGRGGQINPLMTARDLTNGDLVLQWTIEETNYGYALKGVRSGRYLDGRAGQIDPVMTARDPTNDAVLSFTFEATNGELNDAYPNIAIKAVRSGRYLDGRAGQIEPVMTARDPTDDVFLQWVFVPINYKLKAVVSDFEFGDQDEIEEQLESEKTVAFITKKTIVAKEVGLTTSVEFSKSVEESFSFGFESTVGIGIETTIEASVPFVASASTTISASFEFSANQQKTTTRTTEFSAGVEFEPQEAGVYEVGMMVYENTNAVLPFTSTVLITGTSEDGTKTYTGEELQGIIYYGGFDCTVVKVNQVFGYITITKITYNVFGEPKSQI